MFSFYSFNVIVDIGQGVMELVKSMFFNSLSQFFIANSLKRLFDNAKLLMFLNIIYSRFFIVYLNEVW